MAREGEAAPTSLEQCRLEVLLARAGAVTCDTIMVLDAAMLVVICWTGQFYKFQVLVTEWQFGICRIDEKRSFNLECLLEVKCLEYY